MEMTVPEAPGEPHWPSVLCAVFLGLGGTASAWCGYQASLWGGHQSARYALASADRVESTRAASMATNQINVDVGTFVAWAQAKSSGGVELQRFLEQRFRPEFKAAFREWVELQSRDEPPATPFQLPSYRLAATERANRLQARAEKEEREGQDANLQSDRYSRSGVIFALALFFAGVAQQFKLRVLRGGILVMSGLALAMGFFVVVTLPRLGPG